jgi:hypothetical protein
MEGKPMKRISLLLAASLVAAAGLSGASYAKGGNGNGGGHGSGGSGNGGSHSASANGHSASGFAPGRAKATGENAAARAPGLVKQQDESAAAFAPGKVKKAVEEPAASVEETAAVTDEPVADDDAAATAKVNFGMLISSIRASRASLAGVDETTAVSVVDVDDLMRGNNRVALENAVADNQDRIADLRADLTALALPDLQAQDIEQTVGIANARDGSLTVFVDRDQ